MRLQTNKNTLVHSIKTVSEAISMKKVLSTSAKKKYTQSTEATLGRNASSRSVIGKIKNQPRPHLQI